MINLLCLLCSLCIQFSAVDIPVYCPVNSNPFVESAKSWILTQSTSPIFQYWADVDDCPYFTTIRDDGSYYQLKFYIPNSANNSSINSTYSIVGYNNTDKIVGSISINNFSVFTYYYFKSGSGHFGGDYNTKWSSDVYFEYQGSFLGCNNMEIYAGQTLVFVGAEYVRPPELPTLPGIGSLSPSGHSSGGSPLESLQGFSWTAHSSSYSQSGHNSHVNPTHATPDFTNATQNLLGQIVDNTNSIIQNTNSLGGALETINGNIINGASAIFNAVSQLNNNFISAYVYDEDKVDEALQNSSMLLFAQTSEDLTQTIINESQVLLDAVHDMDEKQDLILYLDLTKWKVPVYSSSTGVNTTYVRPYNEVVEIDFTFLKETKSIWQPILLGVLYLALFMSIYFDLPNILRGANA